MSFPHRHVINSSPFLIGISLSCAFCALQKPINAKAALRGLLICFGSYTNDLYVVCVCVSELSYRRFADFVDF